MTDDEFEALLTVAAIRAGELDYLADMPPDDELKRINHPSPRFQHRMQTMLRNPEAFFRKLHRPVYLRILRTAAVIVITCAVLLGAAMAVSPTVRAAVIDFVSSWFEDRTEYKVPDGTVGTGWTFEYIPEGFELVGDMEGETQISRFYFNSQSESLSITISTGQEAIDNEHSNFYQVTINGCKADVYEATDEVSDSIIVMYDDSAGVIVTLSAPISIGELTKIADNIHN